MHTDMQAEPHSTHAHACRHAHTHTHTTTDKETDRQTARQAGKQTDVQTDRWTDQVRLHTSATRYHGWPVDALRKWVRSDLGVIMVGPWMLCGSG